MIDMLDRAIPLILSNERENIFGGLYYLYEQLYRFKRSVTPEEWQALIQKASAHEINGLLAASPQFNHAQRWPRRYLGDAVFMDMIYGLGGTGRNLAEASLKGRYINEFIFGLPVEQAIRRARIRSAQTIDRIAYSAKGSDSSHILSVGCGHLREACLSCALKDRITGRFVALDQDRKSLDLVAEAYGELGVETVHADIEALCRGGVVSGGFDLIYAANLYEYLDDETAKRLTRCVFEMLNPGGSLMITNISPFARDSGVMEALMNWPLVYRDQRDLKRMAGVLPKERIERMRTYEECFYWDNCLVYMEVSRKRE